MTVRLRCSQCRRTAEHPYSLVDDRPPDTAELFDQMRVKGWRFSAILWGPRHTALCPSCEYTPPTNPEPSSPLPPPPARAEQTRLEL